MVSKRLIYTLGGICASAIISVAGVNAVKAVNSIEADVPVAGISVALNNFFEENDNADAEILKYLGIDESVQNRSVVMTEAEEAETEAPEEESPYADVAVSQVGSDDGYVNVRSEASTDGEILGKVYNNCAATILDKVEGEDGEWYHISSGSVEGYIKAEYFVTGDEAEALAIKIGKIFGYVNAGGLRLREEPNTESEVITKLWSGETYSVIEQADGFVKISIGEDDDGTSIDGYVSEEYIDVYVTFDKAISLEEEAAKIAEEEARARRAREAEERLAAAQAASNAAAAAPAPAPEAPAEPAPAPAPAPEAPNNVSSATRDAIVAYALQFVGCPYVYGGTSLSGGSDCSGFTMGVMGHFGIGLTHSSKAQAGQGASISYSDVRPGDLLFYGRGGSIGHVGIYIGNGQIVHAASERTGVTISSSNYSTILKCVNVIGD